MALQLCVFAEYDIFSEHAGTMKFAIREVVLTKQQPLLSGHFSLKSFPECFCKLLKGHLTLPVYRYKHLSFTLAAEAGSPCSVPASRGFGCRSFAGNDYLPGRLLATPVFIASE